MLCFPVYVESNPRLLALSLEGIGPLAPKSDGSPEGLASCPATIFPLRILFSPVVPHALPNSLNPLESALTKIGRGRGILLTRLSILVSLEACNQAVSPRLAIQPHGQRKQSALVGLYWCDFLGN